MKIARPYADALANTAEAAGTLAATRVELAAFTTTVESSAELHGLFASPAVPPDGKKAVLEAILEILKPSDAVANFLRLLLQNTRMHYIATVNRAFAAEVDRRMGVVNAEITSAHALTDAERRHLQERLQAVTGKSVNLSFKTDDALIGGVVTRIGSRIYDGSVRSKLDAYRRQMTGQVRA